MPKIELDEKYARTAWFALQSYKERLEKDLETKYDGMLNWSNEDEEFLVEQIQKVDAATHELQKQGINY